MLTTTHHLVTVSRENANQWLVLLIDDDTEHLRVISQVLSFLGAQVIAAQSFEEADAVLDNITPTFVLMDLYYRRGSAYDFIARARGRLPLGHVPILALTAHLSERDRRHLKLAGFDGVVPKPFRISRLIKTIQANLSAPAAAV